jgi:hypothetical protein
VLVLRAHYWGLLDLLCCSIEVCVIVYMQCWGINYRFHACTSFQVWRLSRRCWWYLKSSGIWNLAPTLLRHFLHFQIPYSLKEMYYGECIISAGGGSQFFRNVCKFYGVRRRIDWQNRYVTVFQKTWLLSTYFTRVFKTSENIISRTPWNSSSEGKGKAIPLQAWAGP